MFASLIATSVGCQRVVGCVDWAPNELLLFAAQSFVVVYDAQVASILAVLNGHEAPVSCVKWIPSQHPELRGWFVSGAADHTIIVWKWEKRKGTKLTTLKDFSTNVVSIAIHVEYEEAQVPNLLMAACSAEPGITIYKNKSSESSPTHLDPMHWPVLQRLSSGSILFHSLALSSLPSNPKTVLLAAGGTDSRIHLFVCSGDGCFSPVCSLPGHENWIRDLDFCSLHEDNKLLLASASQDRFARVWSISVFDRSTKLHRLSLLAPTMNFKTAGLECNVKLEGLLTGHEDWVHTARFSPVKSRGLELLTASMDRTMILWQWDALHKWWIQKDSVGDAGSSSLGYFGGVYSPDGLSILAHGFTGALHHWKKDKEGCWVPQNASSGHYSEVSDICLGIGGNQDEQTSSMYLMSVGKDQTTRISAFVNNRWCEIARPQVHGHDLYSIVYIPGTFPSRFASCSEEKVVRIFEAPLSFHQYLHLHNLSSIVPDFVNSEQNGQSQKKVAFGATIKALALTNTAIYQEGEYRGAVHEEFEAEGVLEDYTPGPEFAPFASPSVVHGPPLEEHLSQNTLWPETHKLYGHGDVVYSLAVSSCGLFLASACKAQREDVARIFLWNTKTWILQQQLSGHTLTVTKMEFSPSGKYLLSGSRDRTFCLFERKANAFELIHHKLKAHGRIIWGISWTPDESLFSTGSRDQTVKIWSIPNCHLLNTIPLQSPVTSLAFQPNTIHPSNHHYHYALAIGMHSGEIEIWTMHSTTSNPDQCQLQKQWNANEHDQHARAVHRIQWSTSQALNLRDAYDTAILATCSADHSIRLFRVEES